jgi:hypothetical protein
MKSFIALLGVFNAAHAHYIFPQVVVGGVDTAEWLYIRETYNHYSLNPVTDVTSPNMTCYQLTPGNEGTSTYTVAAGTNISITSSPTIYHPGPLSVWLAKVPTGYTAATWDGSGAYWTKIYQDQAIISTSGISWPNVGDAVINVKIPSCLEDGDYILRPEHLALHVAYALDGAQFFLSCVQLTVTGGTGTWAPTSKVEIPGVYVATDPGIFLDIYWPIPTNYTPPGPAAQTC